MVDRNRAEGAGDKAKGGLKQAVGSLTGDEKLKAEGKADKTAGKARSAVGGVKDAVRDAVKPRAAKKTAR